jgi:hypothetical protein
MKINNLFPSFNNQPNKQQKINNGFIEFLDENPRSVHGDEYYWAHQSELQQSSLTFTAIKNAPMSPRSISLTDNSTISHSEEETLIATANKVPAEDIPYADPLREKVLSDQFINPKSNQLTYLPKSECSVAYSAITESRELTNEFNQKLRLELPTIRPLVLKKHHLFVDVDQQHAEFSVSTYELNSTEQQQIVQLVKNHLKEKGLFLRKLIINGVCHD